MEDPSIQLQKWMNKEVIDPSGEKIGTVVDLYYDEATQVPGWVLVKTGIFGTKRTFVPAFDLQDQDDRLAAPYSKGMVNDAPRVDPGEELSLADEDQLYAYYGLPIPGQEPVPEAEPDLAAAPISEADPIPEAESGPESRAATGMETAAAGVEPEQPPAVPPPCRLVRFGGEVKSQPLGMMAVTQSDILCGDETEEAEERLEQENQAQPPQQTQQDPPQSPM